MALSSQPIDDLIINMGERDKSADSLVPPLERDPLLRGLAELALKLRSRSSATGPAMSSSQQLQMKR